MGWLNLLPHPLPIRWVYLKGIFSFLTKWKVKKVEGTLLRRMPAIY
jgi:hypothetical protein